jgi:hypothetical protein
MGFTRYETQDTVLPADGGECSRVLYPTPSRPSPTTELEFIATIVIYSNSTLLLAQHGISISMIRHGIIDLNLITQPELSPH